MSKEHYHKQIKNRFCFIAYEELYIECACIYTPCNVSNENVYAKNKSE